MRSATAGRMRSRLMAGSRPARAPKSGDLLLTPPSTSGRQAGLVLIPGFNISSAAYKPVLAAMQRAAESQGLSLFAGCAHFDWQSHPIRQPGDLWDRIGSVVQAMQRRGLPTDGPVFHAAHSMSTTFLQDHLAQGHESAGQILLGGHLLRKHCYPIFTYNVPTLTVHAELDGEETVMRQAEQYSIHRCLDPAKFPMVILEGQTHMQFASGSRPAHLRQELPPAVEEVVAHKAVGDVAVDFMRMRLGERDAGLVIEQRSKYTQALLFPMLLPQGPMANASQFGFETAMGPQLRLGGDDGLWGPGSR